MAKRKNTREATANTITEEIDMNAHRRPVPARVQAVQELRRSGAAGQHADKRREESRRGCRGNGRRAALREQLV